jgi:phosphonate transport system substrate-binding protein
MHTRWTPFLERLSRETGFQFRLKLFDKMAEFEHEIWGGTTDFIFSSPIQTVVAHKSNGYVPLLRASKKVAIGLYVRKESPIRNIDDLTGKKIAFVGNKNLCSVFVRNLLATNENKISFASDYTGSTKHVIINVLRGKSDAGAVYLPEYQMESAETHQQLRELLMTPDMAPHPLSAHPRVPKADQERVKKVTLAIAETKEGMELLTTIMLKSPVTADYERDYRSMESIDVKGLTNWGQ